MTTGEPLFGPRLDFLNKIGDGVTVAWRWFWRASWFVVKWGVIAFVVLWCAGWVIEKAGEPGRTKQTAESARREADRALGEAAELRGEVSDLEDRIVELEARLGY